MTSDEFSDIEQLDENLRKWFKEKWVRFGPDGKIRGACARGSDKEGKPKCLPQSKAHSIGKKGRKYAGAKKRREDPNPERTGKAKNVATKKKTNEDIPFNECPSCRGPIVHESMMTEKQDACYHKVKSRYKVWPSAYASGALVQCRKKGASNWGTGGKKKNESSIMKGIVDEAGSAAQQAAIAISKKERGEKPKNEASGTPGGLERYRTPAMVNATMQQSLYKRDLAPIKRAEKLAKQKAYRDANPQEPVRLMKIGAGTYPIPVIQNWIDTKDINNAMQFASNKFGNKQSKEFKAELVSDPKFKEAFINLLNVGADNLTSRNAMAAKNKGSVNSDYRSEEQTGAGFDAVNRINDILLSYYKKFGVDRTGRRVPPGFNYNLGEGVIIDHDKDDPQVAVLGGAGSYKLSNLKKKALGEAKQLAADIANGEYKNSAYNVKQLANTLNTIVAAEEEMEKLYFGEDYTGQFAAEKTPKINPYGGLKDNQFRGAISETPTDNPTGASSEGGLRKYRPKSAGTFNEEELDEACWKGYHKEGNKKMFGKTYPNCVKNTNEEEQLDEGVMQKIGAAAMAAALALVGAKANAEPVYVYQDVAGKYSAALSPQDIPNDAVRKLVVDTDDDSVAILKGNSKIPINLTPAMVNNIKQRAGIGQVEPTQSQTQPTPSQQTAPTQQEKSVAVLDKSSLVFTGYTVDEIKEIMTNDIESTYPDAEVEDKGRSLVSTRYNVQGKNFGATIMTAVLKGGNGTMDVITRYNFAKMGEQIRVTPQQFYRMQNVFGQAEMVDGNPGGVVKSWNKYFNPELFTKKSKKKTNEEQLDEKCWDTHKQVGMKNKGGRQVPNCVPKESAIMKGLKR